MKVEREGGREQRVGEGNKEEGGRGREEPLLHLHLVHPQGKQCHGS